MCKNNNKIIIIRNHLPLWQRQGGKALGEDHKVGEARAVQPVLLAASMGARRGLPGQGQGPGGQIGEGREEGGGTDYSSRARAHWPGPTVGSGARDDGTEGRGGAGASRGRGEPQQRRGPDGGRPEVGAVGAWLPVSGLERGQGGDRAGIRWGGDRRTGVEPGAELEGRAYSLGAALPPPPPPRFKTSPMAVGKWQVRPLPMAPGEALRLRPAGFFGNGGEVPEEKATPIRMQNAWGPRHLKAVRRLWLAGRDAI